LCLILITSSMTLTASITRSLYQLRIKTPQFQSTQIRTKITKTKKRRLLKKATALPKRTPPNHVPKTQAVIVSPIAQRDSLARTPEDQRLSNLLSERSSKLSKESPPLRYNFTALQDEMSPSLRKLFDLTNGSSNELAKAQKARAMELFETTPGDTGSSAVQIMALTSRIQQMQKHIGTHRKEFSGKRGLDAMYVRRRKLLDYLERKDFDTYSTVVKALGLVR